MSEPGFAGIGSATGVEHAAQGRGYQQELGVHGSEGLLAGGYVELVGRVTVGRYTFLNVVRQERKASARRNSGVNTSCP